MNINDLQKPLPIDDIEFRVQSINRGGYATILAYKSARIDIRRLNEVCTPLGWKREHSRENHNCTVSVWDVSNKQWVSKEDTGTESMAEAQKGLASDSFKRACFNWGIGLELYDYPAISVKLHPDEWETVNGKIKQTYKLKLKDWNWTSRFKNGKVSYLSAINEGKFRYKHGAIIGEISGEPIDEMRIIEAVKYFVGIIDAADDEEEDITAGKVQVAYKRLSKDEECEVNNQLKQFKEGKRQFNTILKGFLDWKPQVCG